MKLAPLRPQMRLLLSLGFGGLLALLTFTGFAALSILHELQVRNEAIRNDYVERAKLLEQLRSDIYLSGTYVRDLLMEEDRPKAEAYRGEFGRTRQRIASAIDKYRAIRQASEAAVFESFVKGTHEYFQALQPALAWDAEDRRIKGRPFMRDEVVRRRSTMMSLANDVGEVNRRQLQLGNAAVQGLFIHSREVLAVLFALTVAVGTVLAALSMGRMLSLEKQARRRYLEAEQSRTEAHELSARLVDAQEEERRRVSRELHDEIGQSLSALLLGLGNLNQTLSPHVDGAVREQIQIMRTLGEKSVGAVRNMSLLLRPSMLDDLGLVAALQWQAREVARATDMRVSVAAEELPEGLPAPLAEELKTSIYRIVQEALHNCQRHSGAKRVRVQLQRTPEKMLLTVQDDGRGFRTEERGLGLLGMEERVNRLGGRFQLSSEEGDGTLVSVELPLHAVASIV